MKECERCGKDYREDCGITSAYGYKVCSQECAEATDRDEHEYRIRYNIPVVEKEV